jgi:hypothetical protein
MGKPQNRVAPYGINTLGKTAFIGTRRLASQIELSHPAKLAALKSQPAKRLSGFKTC